MWLDTFDHSTWPQGVTGVQPDEKDTDMLETIAVILVILWVLGFVSAYTMGGFIHVLLVIAAVMILVRLIQGRRL
jgi:uncharacterized membrane protein YjdF